MTLPVQEMGEGGEHKGEGEGGGGGGGGDYDQA